MAEKEGADWPDKPADENISTDPPSQFDRNEGDYEPGVTPPRRSDRGKRDDSASERDSGAE